MHRLPPRRLPLRAALITISDDAIASPSSTLFYPDLLSLSLSSTYDDTHNNNSIKTGSSPTPLLLPPLSLYFRLFLFYLPPPYSFLFLFLYIFIFFSSLHRFRRRHHPIPPTSPHSPSTVSISPPCAKPLKISIALICTQRCALCVSSSFFFGRPPPSPLSLSSFPLLSVRLSLSITPPELVRIAIPNPMLIKRLLLMRSLNLCLPLSISV